MTPYTVPRHDYIMPRRTIRSDVPIAHPAALGGMVYQVEYNRNMAICALLPNGYKIGVKPYEFDWCDAAGVHQPQPVNPAAQAVWDGNRCRDGYSDLLERHLSHLNLAVKKFTVRESAKGTAIAYAGDKGRSKPLIPLILAAKDLPELWPRTHGTWRHAMAMTLAVLPARIAEIVAQDVAKDLGIVGDTYSVSRMWILDHADLSLQRRNLPSWYRPAIAPAV